MADRNFQSTNSTIIIDHTKISTPTNILIKGTDQVAERKNLLCKNFCKNGSIIKPVGAFDDSYTRLQQFDQIIIFSTKGSDKRTVINLKFEHTKSYLNSNDLNKKYTLTFKVNKIENLIGTVKLQAFDGTTGLNLSSDKIGIYSLTGNITTANFNNNFSNLLTVDINTTNILEKGKETTIEIELLSLELGDHVKDPLLYMPETPFERSILNTPEEIPLITNNSLITAGAYRLEGEVSLFLQEIEKLIDENYDFFSPSKQELILSYKLSRGL